MRVTPYSGDAGEICDEAVQLAHRLGLDLFRHARGFQFLAQVIHVARRLVAFAQFFLDGLQLLAQIELALALRELPLHLRLNAAAQLEQFQLARQVAVDLVRAATLPSSCSSRCCRSAGLSEGRLPATKSASLPGFRDLLRRCCVRSSERFGRGRHDLLEQADHVLPQRFDLRRHLRLDVRQALHLRAQERLGGGVVVGADPRDAFAEQQQVVLRHADGLVHHADGARSGTSRPAWRIHARIELRDHGQRAVLSERLHQRHRTRPSDRDRQQRAGKNYGVSDRRGRAVLRTGCLRSGLSGGFFAVVSSTPWPQCTPGHEPAERLCALRDSSPARAECPPSPADGSARSAHWANPSRPRKSR